MTREEIIKEFSEMGKTFIDNEAIHANADNLLLRFLIDSGYEDVADAYTELRERVGFWYA